MNNRRANTTEFTRLKYSTDGKHCESKLEYLAVYGRASMGVPVDELQSTEAPTTDCDWTAIGPRTTFCDGRTET